MTTHRHAWLQRAGVVVALATSALLALPAVAASAQPRIDVSPGSVTLQAGSDATVTVRINGSAGDGPVTISLTGLPNGVSCASGCGTVPPNVGTTTQLLTLKAAANAPDANSRVTVRAEANPGGPDTGDFTLIVKGAAPPEAQTVKEVSGRVVDAATGDPVADADVGLQDSAGHNYPARTNSNGAYRFTGSSGQPIAPGQIRIGAAKGNVTNTKTVSANAGQVLNNQKITLKLTAATPSATPSASEPPTEEPPETPGDANETPGDATGQPAASDKKSDEGGFSSWLLIIVGGLLVALGVGAIVLLVMRRKENNDDEPDGPGAGAGGPRGAVP
ncbi:carboxypeptidase-like regulatory domain-containing protein, partial [Micromonospora zhanjiangensis]